MKPTAPTYGQLENWIKTSQSWEKMRTTPDKRKQMTVKHGSPYVNMIWWHICREFREKWNEVKVYKHINLMHKREVQPDDWEPYAYIHTSICGILENTVKFTIKNMYWGNYATSEKRFSVVPPKNMPLTEENIIKFVLKYCDDNVFYKGKWGELQKWLRIDKALLKEQLRWAIKNKKSPSWEELQEQEEKKLKWIKKHFNIDSNLDLELTIKWVNKLGKQQTPITLCKMDYDFMYDHDGDIDELEEVFWDEMENYPKNAYFIN
jgi:hypothetical protein